ELAGTGGYWMRIGGDPRETTRSTVVPGIAYEYASAFRPGPFLRATGGAFAHLRKQSAASTSSCSNLARPDRSGSIGTVGRLRGRSRPHRARPPRPPELQRPSRRL